MPAGNGPKIDPWGTHVTFDTWSLIFFRYFYYRRLFLHAFQWSLYCLSFNMQGIDLRVLNFSKVQLYILLLIGGPLNWSLECFFSKRFGINIVALKQMSLNDESWKAFIHQSCCFIYVLFTSGTATLSPEQFSTFSPSSYSEKVCWGRGWAEPVGKRKKFLRHKTVLSYILFTVIKEVAAHKCTHGYILVWCSIIPTSLFLLYGVSFWLFADTLPLHFFWCFFSPYVVSYVLLPIAHLFHSVSPLVSSIPLFDVCGDGWVSGKLLLNFYDFGP